MVPGSPPLCVDKWLSAVDNRRSLLIPHLSNANGDLWAAPVHALPTDRPLPGVCPLRPTRFESPPGHPM